MDKKLKINSPFSILHSPFQKGFTLVELLITIAVLAVISGIVIAIINPGTQLAKARDARRKNDMHQIQVALEAYKSDNGHYPPSPDWINSSQGDQWIPGLSPQYMQKLPRDPSSSGGSYTGFPGWYGKWDYAYYAAAYPSTCAQGHAVVAGDDYMLIARAENTADPAAIGQTLTYAGCPTGVWTGYFPFGPQ
ncbi:MAG TPA: prepilin-type N-terminal cleavage/methylation domain-containing protein [Candidatus Saccharimonadales bacterium]|nr:prepilin-type N-terminal cleavage/methylation domain-containing protein [Candidatus Saccharimonadales bacterium]